jgi:hypothetical protein
MIEQRPRDDEGDRQDIIESSIDPRSLSVEGAPEDATGNDLKTVTRNVMPLLGLEPATAENTEENPDSNEDSNRSAMSDPLLGTTTANTIETLGKSSTGRSPKRVCYGPLLRFRADSRPGKPQKSAKDGAANAVDLSR